MQFYTAVIGFALVSLGAAEAIAKPQVLELAAIIALGPPPAPSIATGVLSRVISFNPTSAASAAAAAITADPLTAPGSKKL